MRAIQGGDALAFEGFVRENERRFFRIALGYLGETEEARDAAQETFVRVWKSRQSWREGTDPGVWARRILARISEGLFPETHHPCSGRGIGKPFEMRPAHTAKEEQK